MRYDPFWLVLLTLLGAALAFYLIGVPIALAALWLWSRKKTYWVCPKCAQMNAPGLAHDSP